MHEKFYQKALFDTNLCKGIIEKPINLNLSGQNTHQGAAQEPSLTHHAKAVAKGLVQVVADPRGPVTTQWRLSTAPSNTRQ